MMREQDARVVAVNGARVRIKLGGACLPDGGCGACGLCGGGKGQPDLELEVEASGPVRVGQDIRVRVYLPHQGLAGLLVFGLPLAGLLFGGFAGMRWGGRSDLAALIGGVSGMFIGLGCLWLADRGLHFLHARAEIVQPLNHT